MAVDALLMFRIRARRKLAELGLNALGISAENGRIVVSLAYHEAEGRPIPVPVVDEAIRVIEALAPPGTLVGAYASAGTAFDGALEPGSPEELGAAIARLELI
jgi:hypothetical protein